MPTAAKDEKKTAEKVGEVKKVVEEKEPEMSEEVRYLIAIFCRFILSHSFFVFFTRNVQDRQLKDDLSMLVQRLAEPDASLYLPSLESLRTQIRSATTSMTSVPKPLKFLREHYDQLRTLYDKMPTDETRRFIADIISILSMTMSSEKYGPGECLKYRLLGSREEIGSWGHEYVRHLAGEVALDWQSENTTADRSADLIRLVKEIVPYHMKHNAEAEAADLLMEIERLDLLDEHVTEEEVCNRVRLVMLMMVSFVFHTSSLARFTKTTFSLVPCSLYLTSCVPYVPDPENTNLLKTSLRLSLKFKKYADAVRLALQLQDVDQVKAIITLCPDAAIQKQMAFMIGRQQVFLGEDITDSDLVDIMSNTHLNNHFLALGRELDIMEPKSPEDIYKSHLESNTRSYGSGQIDSARANLASSFVNGFVNCAFGKDKLLMVEEGNKVSENSDCVTSCR